MRTKMEAPRVLIMRFLRHIRGLAHIPTQWQGIGGIRHNPNFRKGLPLQGANRVGRGAHDLSVNGSSGSRARMPSIPSGRCK